MLAPAGISHSTPRWAWPRGYVFQSSLRFVLKPKGLILEGVLGRGHQVWPWAAVPMLSMGHSWRVAGPGKGVAKNRILWHSSSGYWTPVACDSPAACEVVERFRYRSLGLFSVGEHMCQHPLRRLSWAFPGLVSGWAHYIALWTKVWTIVGMSL